MPHIPSPARIQWSGKGAAEIESCITQTHTTQLGARTVSVEGAIPQLDTQEYGERMRAIEGRLYDIFIQYEDKTAGA